MINLDFYGDKTKWFVGIVRELGANDLVRVRVFGIHRMDDVTDVSDGDLPWAAVIYPTTGKQRSHDLKPGDMVVGFYADGDDCQLPVITGLVGGSTYSSSHRTSRAFSGDNGTYEGTGPIAPINLPGNTNAQKGYNYIRYILEQSGCADPDVSACGVCGNIMLESTWDPQIRNPKGGAYGLCQWLYPTRRAALTQMYGIPCSFEEQLAFMFWEYNNTHQKLWKRLKAAPNIEEATATAALFEGGEDVTNGVLNRNHPLFRKRLGYAKGYYEGSSPLRNSYIPPTETPESRGG